MLEGLFDEQGTVFLEKVKPIRDTIEREFLDRIYTDIGNKSKAQLLADCIWCANKEGEYQRLALGRLT